MSANNLEQVIYRLNKLGNFVVKFYDNLQKITDTSNVLERRIVELENKIIGMENKIANLDIVIEDLQNNVKHTKETRTPIDLLLYIKVMEYTQEQHKEGVTNKVKIIKHLDIPRGTYYRIINMSKEDVDKLINKYIEKEGSMPCNIKRALEDLGF